MFVKQLIPDYVPSKLGDEWILYLQRGPLNFKLVGQFKINYDLNKTLGSLNMM